ncbi:CPBP family intramembrane metalloprotease [Clostridium sp. YIM B02515]|uniref:CPBP family intramembrane metalloprotease n=1 Tax=Clostridium rhizosphaerae TaxID=2803861 RepID=A0ABS1T8R7_9CLOT|nr:CPBP family intramembrane glutamic endopeptidase [Clostridium rhizosphaerae]MBL4935735.1 CPBP family intramembrane metalloprotease [Clostridium rhizosphaerae]
MTKSLQNILVFIFLYIPPLLFFLKYSLRRNINKILLFIISVLYIILAVYTQNILPFILVLINIRYIRVNDTYGIYNSNDSYYTDLSKDYYRYNFSLKSFNIFKGLKYAAESYGLTIAVNIIVALIISLSKSNLKEQEIVRQLMDTSINKFVYMIPVMVIFAPIVEEFTFRWLLFEKIFKPRIGICFSAILSSILFSMVHFNIRVFPVLITIGLINCYLIEKKGYWYAVFNHLIFNTVSTVAMLMQKIS